MTSGVFSVYTVWAGTAGLKWIIQAAVSGSRVLSCFSLKATES